MKQYGVLVVDDSAFMRKLISLIIEQLPEFYVIGKARNGVEALEKTARLKPDVVMLDVEMPVMDGFEALTELLRQSPVPIVMLTNDEQSSVEAFARGAVDFFLKKELLKKDNTQEIEDFHKRLQIAVIATIKVPIQEEIVPVAMPITLLATTYKLLVIGSSTGGPSALQKILPHFPENMPVPIIIVQHMPVGFTKPLAERFNKLCRLQVKEAEHHEILKAGTIYIAPAGIQTLVVEKNEQLQIQQKISAPIETLYRPSIDVTLLSIAKTLQNTLLTVILTGMGDDGLRGCKLLKQQGGTLIAEAEETCVIYGMPKVVAQAGLVDYQLPLYEIFDAIMLQMQQHFTNKEK